MSNSFIMQRSFVSAELIHHAKVVSECGAHSSCKGHFQAHSSIVVASSRVTPLNFLTDFPSRLIFDHRKYLPSFNRISIAHSFLIMAPRTLSTSDRLSWRVAHGSLLCFKKPPEHCQLLATVLIEKPHMDHPWLMAHGSLSSFSSSLTGTQPKLHIDRPVTHSHLSRHR